MKGLIFAGAVLFAIVLAAVLLYGISDYVLGLAIKRKGSLRRAVGQQDVLGGSWEKYREKTEVGREWYERQPYEEEEVISFDGLRLKGRLYSGTDKKDAARTGQSGRKAVIMAHGYRGGPQDLAFPARFFSQRGYDVLLISQRSHGESQGCYICFGQLECRDIKEWIYFLQKKLGRDTVIFLYGVSMGATSVMMAAGLDLPPQVRGVIADCGFTGFGSMAKRMLKKSFHLPLWPFYPLADKIFRRKTGGSFAASTEDALKKSMLPLLLIHGREDHFVPPEMSLENYQASAAAKEDKRICFVEGAAHGKAVYEDTEGVFCEIEKFLDRYEKG